MSMMVYVSKSVPVGNAVSVAWTRIQTPVSACLYETHVSNALAAPKLSRSEFPNSPCCKSVPTNTWPMRFPMAVVPDFVPRTMRREVLYGFWGRPEKMMVVPAPAPPPVVLPHEPPKVSAVSGSCTWPSPSGGEPGAFMGRQGGEWMGRPPVWPPWWGCARGEPGGTMMGAPDGSTPA